jgi:hypothetical protein
VSAFAPKTLAREVSGVPVVVRSLTMAQAHAHQKRMRENTDRAEAVATLILLCCRDAAGGPLFANVAEVLDADADIAAKLAELVFEANGMGKEPSSNATGNPTT